MHQLIYNFKFDYNALLDMSILATAETDTKERK